MEEKIKLFYDMIQTHNRIVFFGGAGVSTESGIPDFRSVDGLYHQEYDYPPETILSHSFFIRNTSEFYRFYHHKMIYADAAPNTTHLALAKLEKEGKLSAVITQNIDGLHQAGGSKNVFELHGSVHRNYCQKCHAFFDLSYIRNAQGIPVCNRCGGTIKPDVVLYEEGLDDTVVEGAISHIRNADCLIIGGTSLAVYPAAGFIDYFRGDKLIIINKTPSPRESMADLVIHASLGEVFGKMNE